MSESPRESLPSISAGLNGKPYDGLSSALKHWSGSRHEWNGDDAGLPLPAAIVVRLETVTPHPNADRLDVLRFAIPIDYRVYGCLMVTLVAGKHYKKGKEGVWFTPGAILPGYMADEMWVGHKPFEVRDFPVRGVQSQGLFAGSIWRKTPEHPYEPWRFWKSSWKAGVDVSDYFGIRLLSSVAEHRLSKSEVAAKTTEDGGGLPPEANAVEASGSTPAAGSNSQVPE